MRKPETDPRSIPGLRRYPRSIEKVARLHTPRMAAGSLRFLRRSWFYRAVVSVRLPRTGHPMSDSREESSGSLPACLPPNNISRCHLSVALPNTVRLDTCKSPRVKRSTKNEPIPNRDAVPSCNVLYLQTIHEICCYETYYLPPALYENTPRKPQLVLFSGSSPRVRVRNTPLP